MHFLVWIINYKATFTHPAYYREGGILHSTIDFYTTLTHKQKTEKSIFTNILVKKVKQSRYRPGVAQRVPGS